MLGTGKSLLLTRAAKASEMQAQKTVQWWAPSQSSWTPPQLFLSQPQHPVPGVGGAEGVKQRPLRGYRRTLLWKTSQESCVGAKSRAPVG